MVSVNKRLLTMYRVHNLSNSFYTVLTAPPVQVMLEQQIFTVNEVVGSQNLALLVCAIANETQLDFEVTLATASESAIGKATITSAQC